MRIRRALIAACFAVALTSSSSAVAMPPEAEGKIIARVGKVEIPAASFFEIYDLKQAKYVTRGREIPQSAARRYRKSILERLTYHEWLRQQVSREGARVDASKLAEREEDARRGIRNFDRHLERRGETMATLRAMYQAELHEAAILHKRGELDVSLKDRKAEYEAVKKSFTSDKERVRASHILITFGDDGRTEAEARALAEKVAKEAERAGADFATLARKHSTGPSARNGGDIGIFTYDRMAEAFSDRCKTLNVGEVSEPVKTKFGYHVIKLSGRWPPGELPFEALDDQITQRLQQRKLHVGRRALKEEFAKGDVSTFFDIETGAFTTDAPVDPSPLSPAERWGRLGESSLATPLHVIGVLVRPGLTAMSLGAHVVWPVD